MTFQFWPPPPHLQVEQMPASGEASELPTAVLRPTALLIIITTSISIIIIITITITIIVIISTISITIIIIVIITVIIPSPYIYKLPINRPRQPLCYFN